MKRKLLFLSVLLCSLGCWAEESTYPEKMYMIGDATDAGWNLNIQAMTTLSDGVYRWEGTLKNGELKFAKDDANYEVPADFWGPTTVNELLVDGKILSTENLTEDKKFSVNEGTYTLTLDLTKNVLRVGNFYDSESGHYIYFKNTDNAWTNVYLRIGRADHVYTKPFEAIEGTDWWRCETPDYAGYTHFTITDKDDATAPVTTYPAGANRLYEYQYDLTEDRWFILTDGPHDNGDHYYWNNTSDLHEYTVYVVPEELGFAVWDSESSLTLEVNWSDVLLTPINQEVAMSPVEEGSHIYKGITRIPVTEVYGLNFKRYQNATYTETFAAHYESLLSADIWNGKIFSQDKNEDKAKKWFDYPAKEYTCEAGHTIYFDNSKTQWDKVYLRIGRAKAHGYSGNHVHSYPFTRIGTTDIWTLKTEEYRGAEAWTITNILQSNDENVYTSASEYRGAMQRVFYYQQDIKEDLCVRITTANALGNDLWETAYWGSEITSENPIYTRDVTNTYGTICLPYGSSNYTGATFYELVGQSAEGVYLGSVDNLEAGVPYVFEKSANQLVVIYEGEVVQDAKSKNGLIGTFDDETEVAIGNYIIANNEICKCEVECYVNANRAYINLAEVPIGAPVKMPGRKYVCMGVQGENQATQLSNIVDSTSSSYKTVENGQLIIVCGGVKYNAQGVKL